MKFITAITVSLALFLAACGGGGSAVQDLPPTLGKAQLAEPIVDAEIELQNKDGELIRTAAHKTDAAGVFELSIPTDVTSRFRIVIRGGTYQGQPFEDRLILDVENFQPGTQLFYVNAATTLIGRYLDRHADSSVAQANSKVKAYLVIPETSSAGFDASNPVQNYFRHENLLKQMQSSNSPNLIAYLDSLVGEMDAGVATHSFGRTPQLQGTSISGAIGKLLKMLMHAVFDDIVSLGFEHLTTYLGIDGTAEILRELHEINHKLDELNSLAHEIRTDTKDTQLQNASASANAAALVIKTQYETLTTMLEQATTLPCAAGKDIANLSAACEEERQAKIALQRQRIEQMMAEILNAKINELSPLLAISKTMVAINSAEPGILARASEFLKSQRLFDAPIDDPRLVELNDFYKTIQIMGTHLLVEAYMYQADNPPGDATPIEQKVYSDAAKDRAAQALNDFEVRTAEQANRMKEMRRQDENTVEQLDKNLIWLRAPISNLPITNADGSVVHLDREASRMCKILADENYSNYNTWRLPTESEFHAFVKGSPNSSGDAHHGNGIFEWLVQQGFQRAPGNGKLYQRGILVDNTMKTAYYSKTSVPLFEYTEALWDYGVDSAVNFINDPRKIGNQYVPSISGAWCVTHK